MWGGPRPRMAHGPCRTQWRDGRCGQHGRPRRLRQSESRSSRTLWDMRPALIILPIPALRLGSTLIMSTQPDFFLTAAGEHKPLEDPRACWVKHRLRDAQHISHFVIAAQLPSHSADTPTHGSTLLIVSPRQKGDALSPIRSWPAHVYVSHMVKDSLLHGEPFDTSCLDVIAWARIYPTLEDARQDADRHASAVRGGRPPEAFNVPSVRFAGEQDGIPERSLKNAMVELFDADERIWKAYLAIVDHGPTAGSSVTLCLRTVMGPDKRLVAQIGRMFASQFHTTQHLDILFLDGEQEAELGRVCRPFYVRTVSRRV